MRCNRAKLLLDPHALALEGEVTWDPAVFGHRLDAPEQPNDEDSAPFMPRCVVTAERLRLGGRRMSAHAARRDDHL